MRQLAALFLFLATTAAFAAPPHLAEKQAAAAAIDADVAKLTALSDEIWRYAETALKETKSSKALADFAGQKGFRVTRGVAGMPTAFVAEFGSGRPVIGIMGEYDALPGLSQKAEPARAVLELGAPGHGCGHNLFGVGSLAAATAVKDLIASGKLHGTVKFFGTPAEEAVGGKLYMLRDGERALADEMLGRVRKAAAGAAMAADVESKVTVNGGDWNMLVNMTGERLAQQNLEWLRPPRAPAAEEA